MKYIINDCVSYDSESATIQYLHDPFEPVHSLTPTANRLAGYLFDNQGRILTKEECLEAVWIHKPGEGSMHTLTQYLGNLRKTFRLYFPDTEFIITHPRQGYSLSTEIKIQCMALAVHETERQARDLHKKYKWIVLGVCTLMLLFLATLLWRKTSVALEINNQSSFLLIKYEGCPVLTLHKLLFSS